MKDDQELLYGLDNFPPSVDSLIRQLSPLHRFQLLRRLNQQKVQSTGSRAQFERLMHRFPEHIRKLLVNGKLKATNRLLYAVKPISENAVSMFRPDDELDTGLCNVAHACLPEKQLMVVCAIYLMAGVPKSNSAEHVRLIDFKSIAGFQQFVNGEISLKTEEAIVEDGYPIRSVFMKEDSSNICCLKLDNPGLILPKQLIKLIIKPSTLHGLPSNTHLWVGIEGTGTGPAVPGS